MGAQCDISLKMIKQFRNISSGLKGTATLKYMNPCADPEGGGGTGGPDPPEISQNIEFLTKTGLDPLENQKASFQCWAIIGPPAKRHLNGVSLADQYWPAQSGIRSLSSQLKKIVVLGPL